jgi:thiamine biosynthesis lipoprotein
MACRFEVTVPSSEPAGISAANSALDEADHLEAQLTIFRETSEVSLINRLAASEPVNISPALFHLLQFCLALYRETEGAFDITSGPLSACWGFLKRQGRLPELEEIEAARALVGSNNLMLNQRDSTIRFLQSGVQINLGSIGKGYALDCLQANLRRRLNRALLSAGSSSLLAIGRGNLQENGWAVGIRHPRFTDRRMAIVRLRDRAMATSGAEEQFFEYQGKRYGHIIDPRSGRPADRLASVTVITESGARADALATAFYVGGIELAERYCSTHPDTLAILFPVDADGPLVFGNDQQCEVEIIDA